MGLIGHFTLTCIRRGETGFQLALLLLRSAIMGPEENDTINCCAELAPNNGARNIFPVLHCRPHPHPLPASKSASMVQKWMFFILEPIKRLMR